MIGGCEVTCWVELCPLISVNWLVCGICEYFNHFNEVSLSFFFFFIYPFNLPWFIKFAILFYLTWILNDVRGNNLIGTIPDNIGNYTNFAIMYVTSLMHWVGFCPNYNFFVMKIRDLSYNQIFGEIPYNIEFLQVATLWVHLVVDLILL